MARQSRINLPSCLYHILCRGNLNYPLFLSDADRRHFLKSLEKYCQLFDFKIHAWCLMDTHVHLLAESTGSNLSEFMRRLILSYTVWFHKKHDTHGHLFSGRFKSLVVDKGAYLLALSRYIHLNPVESGNVQRAEDYPWSSLRFYINPKTAPSFLHTKETLVWFGGSSEEYLRYIREGLNEDTKPVILKQRYVGEEAFARRINAQHESMKSKKPTAGKSEKEKRDNAYAESRLNATCAELDLDVESFKRHQRRGTESHKALMRLVYLLRENTEWSYCKISEFLGVSAIHAQKLYGKACRKG